MSDRLTPTRGTLQTLEERIEAAERALDILERRRDVLVMEFQDVLDQHRHVERSLDGTFEDARHRSVVARASEGEIALRSAAMARADHPTVTRRTRNVMGVQVPQYRLESTRRGLSDRGWGFVGSTGTIDATAEAYETLLDRVVRAAETRASVLLLLDALESTVRRVNALEKMRLPELRDSHHDIQRKLEERDRQETVIRKWVKDNILDESDADSPTAAADRDRPSTPTDAEASTDDADADGPPERPPDQPPTH